jgi:hypothetical protein
MKPARIHRRLQFTLRTLIGLVLLVSLVFAWVIMRVGEARRERTIAAALHASVECDGHYGSSSETFCEWLLRKSLGNDVGGAVRVARLTRVEVTDADWQKLGELRHLDELWLSGFNLKHSDEIVRIAELRLNLLGVNSVEMNEQVLSSLARLSGLRVLFLGTNHGLRPGDVHRLRILLPNTRVIYVEAID